MGCSELKSNENLMIFPKTQNFGDYWNQGKAELNRYDLQQVRYGDIHKGDAVLIFVTEDFLKDEQVKYEYGPRDNDIQSVLKLNFSRKFYTGIYPYSLMTSIFFPIQSYGKHAIKISSTAQEWCGQSFMQLNNRDNSFNVQLNSYFQKEVDKHFQVPETMLEDEIWTLIRVNPDLLPLGSINIIPGMQYLRLLHSEIKGERAKVEKKKISDPELSQKSLIKYSVQYQDLSRRLEIIYEEDFPHLILAWEEVYQPLKVNTSKNELMITKARRTNTIILDYWNKNGVADSTYRIGFEDVER